MPSGFTQRSRHRTVLYFRRRVPGDLVSLIGQRQLYRSLRTADPRLARLIARSLAAYTDAIFDRVRAMKKRGKSAKELKEEFDAAWGSFGTSEEPPQAKKVVGPQPGSSGDSVTVNYNLKVTGWNEYGPTFEVQTEPNDPNDAEAGTAAVARLVGARGARQQHGVLTLKGAVDEFMAGSELKTTSLKNYDSYFRNVILPFFGSDTAVECIEQSEISRFANHLKALDRARQTKEGYLMALSALGTYLRTQGRVTLPPWMLRSSKLLGKRPKPGRFLRDALSEDQIKVIFRNAARYRTSAPAKFWVSILPTFLGCRVGEVAQINLHTDLHYDEEKDLYFFDLNEDPDEDGVVRKAIKREASWRVVPIPSALVQRGLIEYLHKTRGAGFSRPFEPVWKASTVTAGGSERRSGAAWGKAVSTWGSKEFAMLAQRGLVKRDNKQTYFHSVRHTFATELSRQEVREEDRAMLQGQSFGKTNSKIYVKLRDDARYLSQIVEKHFKNYVTILDDAIANPLPDPERAKRGRPKKALSAES